MRTCCPAIWTRFVLSKALKVHLAVTPVTRDGFFLSFNVNAAPVTTLQRDVWAKPAFSVYTKVSRMKVKVTVLAVLCNAA